MCSFPLNKGRTREGEGETERLSPSPTGPAPTCPSNTSTATGRKVLAVASVKKLNYRLSRAPPLINRRSFASKTQPSATSQFYRSFTRPIAKTLLIAVFTYQLAYWTWVKLETDEIRAERGATIAELETTIKDYDAANKAKKA
ncbi:hypothetical protein DER45DRAFT_110609 [Fusarium avenaceum]|nr:hypothetical protein DER45DRAFT_110609 [Fusarium avenaceum]